MTITLETIHLLPTHDYRLFMSVVKAMQEMKAVTLDDNSFCFDLLSQEKKQSAIRALLNYLSNKDIIHSASDLHSLHTKLLIDGGWRFGIPFNENKKISPVLCTFENLPEETRYFLVYLHALLKTMATPLLAAIKGVI